MNIGIYTLTLKATQLCTDWIQHWCRSEGGKGETHRHHQLKGLLVHPHGRLVLLHHCEGSGFTSNLHNNKHTRQHQNLHEERKLRFLLCCKQGLLGELLQEVNWNYSTGNRRQKGSEPSQHIPHQRAPLQSSQRRKTRRRPI